MARFVNRFGKRQAIYAKTLNELRTKLREEQYKDEKDFNGYVGKSSRYRFAYKNLAKQIITNLSKEEKKERRVLTIGETETFLKQTEGTLIEEMKKMEQRCI